MSRTIELTQHQVATVDDDDFERINAHKWYARWNPDIRSYYALRTEYDEDGARHTILMHRQILDAQPGEQCDHRSHATLDNRQANLRICTNAENSYNARARTGCSSRWKGCSWRKQRNKWVSYISYKGRRYHLGLFTAERAAARAYDRAAVKYFGEYAKLNFPQQQEVAV